jgi:DNA polymerase V
MDGSVAGVFLPGRTTRLSRPVIGWRVPAGFPSPAEDYVEGRIDLTRDLVRHPLATYYVRVEGDSMEPLIRPGALLLVDRMAESQEGDIVIARVGDELCVKRLHTGEDGRIRLLSENSAYAPIVIAEEVDFEVWGRVMYSIQQH